MSVYFIAFTIWIVCSPITFFAIGWYLRDKHERKLTEKTINRTTPAILRRQAD